MAEKSSSYLSREFFLEDLRDLNQSKRRFCFILGSGASLSSGIPTGQNMMELWFNFLSGKTRSQMQTLCTRTEVPWSTWERLYKLVKNGELEKAKLPNEYYFPLYDLRYGRNPGDGRSYLTQKMRNAQPSRGYDLLSKLMNETGNNVVITTNFDHLTEDSFTLNRLGFPQVLDPNTAHEMQEMPPEIPIVAKVHGDAMLNPLNRSRELKKLAKVWQDKLPVIFASYIPIVIGYGGGDRTLMAYLEECTWLRRVYWCSMGERETNTIEQFLQAKEYRHLVPMNREGSPEEIGFDGIMAEIYDALMPGEGTKPAETPTAKPSKPTPVSPSTAPVKTPAPEPEKPAVTAEAPSPKPQKQKQPLPVLSRDRLRGLGKKGTIETLVFRDTLAGAPDGSRDLSEAGDESVLCWRVGNTLTIAGEGGVAAPKSCSELFKNWKALRTVTGAELLDTSGVTDMSWMFWGCGSLQTLEVGSWNTGNVMTMRCMFCGCGSLQTLEVGSWNTGNVTDMWGMFYGCGSLQTLEVGNWNTRNVTDMRRMFCGCGSLQTLDVSSWNTGNVTTMWGMFDGTRWKSNPPIRRIAP